MNRRNRFSKDLTINAFSSKNEAFVVGVFMQMKSISHIFLGFSAMVREDECIMQADADTGECISAYR